MKNIIRRHPVRTRLVLSIVVLISGINCLIIGNLIKTTTLMALGIISLPISIIILNSVSSAAIRLVDEITEDEVISSTNLRG
jgi:hypothetical protein